MLKTAEEREIDRLVYDFYGLTEDEIAIVEGRNKLTMERRNMAKNIKNPHYYLLFIFR